jgi:site-specific DNA-cytosine methylase
MSEQPRRMLDLFCGRGGWTNAFLERGWEVVGVDIVRHLDYRGEFVQADVMGLSPEYLAGFDFICASSPCEEFSMWGMLNFHPRPKYPKNGIRLFSYSREICEDSGKPYVMENVKEARKFVGEPFAHCGPYYLWGNAVPTLLPQGITKGIQLGGNFKNWKAMTREERRAARKTDFMIQYQSGSKERKECTAKAATIPPELAHCVAEYAERILENR